jgi:hypothetical protein
MRPETKLKASKSIQFLSSLLHYWVGMKMRWEGTYIRWTVKKVATGCHLPERTEETHECGPVTSDTSQTCCFYVISCRNTSFWTETFLKGASSNMADIKCRRKLRRTKLKFPHGSVSQCLNSRSLHTRKYCTVLPISLTLISLGESKSLHCTVCQCTLESSDSATVLLVIQWQVKRYGWQYERHGQGDGICSANGRYLYPWHL